MRGSAGVWGASPQPSEIHQLSSVHPFGCADDQGKRKEKKDIRMTVDRKVSSIESSFQMENMLFDEECRKRVKDILAKNISAVDAVAELNRKYRISTQKMEDQ